MPTWRNVLSLVVIGASAASDAEAVDYPRKPIRLIVPFVADTGTDILARTLSERLTTAWRQPIVVDNRPGGGGMIGALLAARATADGYTLLLANVAALAIAPAMQTNDAFDASHALAPVTQISAAANVLLVHPALGVSTTQELVALAQAKPNTIRYASGGAGTAGHLAGELFNVMAGTRMVHAPYPGSPAAMTAILSGDAQASFTSLVSSLPHIKASRLRAVAVTTIERTPALPEVPTLHESGVKDFEVSGWQAVLAPAGTPEEIRQKLQLAIAGILHTPAVAAHMQRLGLQVVASSPQTFGRYLDAEVAKWGALVRRLGSIPAP